MKNLTLMAAALVLGLTLVSHDAEAARRLGGGGSAGMQRQSVTPSKTHEAAPAQPAHQQAAPAPAKQATPAQPAPAQAAPARSSWMGPLAGLAAGIGLAALASHFGFGEGLANFMMIGLLVMGAVMLFGFLMRKKAAARPADGMQYAAAGPAFDPQPAPATLEPLGGGSAAPVAAAAASSGFVPASFDTAGFVKNAKVMFLRLQAANDAGNIEDIREFTSPEMFAEVKLALAERPAGAQETDVLNLAAEVVDVSEEATRYIVSVRFTGQIREERNGPQESFDEVWHMTKPSDGSRGWVLAGIQQVQ